MPDAFLNPLSSMTKKVVEQEEPKTFSSDYKYASNEDIKIVTLNQLAKLEVDLHSLRIIYVANGENIDALVAPNRTLREEMAKVNKAIAALESYFSEVLSS